jgi:hypothetical protein
MDTNNQDLNHRGFSEENNEQKEHGATPAKQTEQQPIFQVPVTAQSSGYTGNKGNEFNQGNDSSQQASNSQRQTYSQHQFQVAVPNSGAILTLGILSIVMLCCCGPFLVGPVLGIIAIALAPSAIRKYHENPDMYKPGSLKNITAGRTCAIIGLSLGVILFFFWLLGSGMNLFDNMDQFEEIYREVWDEMGY